VARFLARPEPRRLPTPRALAIDAVIAAAATFAVLAEALSRSRTPPGFAPGTVFIPASAVVDGARHLVGYIAYLNGQSLGLVTNIPRSLSLQHPNVLTLAVISLTAAPLAFRRRFPVAAVALILSAILAAGGWTPSGAFLAVIFAAYSAVVYSRYRQLALLTVLAGTLAVTAEFPGTTPHIAERYNTLLVVVAAVSVAIGMRQWQQRAGDSAERLRRAQAEHEAATRRAVALERARIASELHDVVTHNVTVMVVQAGASRQVLETSPGEARQALLAVEASGRTALAELRHLLGLLSPGEAGDQAGDQASAEQASAETGDAVLAPQPGLSRLPSLLSRVTAAGLPVDLRTTGTPYSLSPGLDLAAYRVVQESLTNVIRHAGPVPATVRLDYLPGELVIEVTDSGCPPAVPAPAPAPGPARGLIGLRERVAVYGGDLDASPRLGGGWRVRARIPLDAACPAPADR
jgi:signal transduction histidine kinase